MKYRKGDRVEVLSGGYIGQTGTVLRLQADEEERWYRVSFESGTWPKKEKSLKIIQRCCPNCDSDMMYSDKQNRWFCPFCP